VTQRRIIMIIAGSEIKHRFMCTGKRGWLIKINAKKRHQESGGHESTFQPQNPQYVPKMQPKFTVTQNMEG
jgi:hypothetical protein